MAIKKSKVTAKKKAVKVEKVQAISKAKKVAAVSVKLKKNAEVAAKKKAVKTDKVQQARPIDKKTKMDAETRMMHDIMVIAHKMGIDVRNVITTELVRAIQRAEGHYGCYRSGEVLTCGQMDCLWRGGCTPF